MNRILFPNNCCLIKDFEPLSNLISDELYPVIPPPWVILWIAEFDLGTMRESLNQSGVWRNKIKWISDDGDNFLTVEFNVSVWPKWMVRFDDPSAIISNVLTLRALKLQSSTRVNCSIRACGKTSCLFKYTSHERVSRSWVRKESNVINIVSITESIVLIEDFFVLGVPKSLILAFQKVQSLF